MARGYRFDAKWVCLMGSYAWGIQVFCSRNEVAPHFSNMGQCLFITFLIFSGKRCYGERKYVCCNWLKRFSKMIFCRSFQLCWFSCRCRLLCNLCAQTDLYFKCRTYSFGYQSLTISDAFLKRIWMCWFCVQRICVVTSLLLLS